jgi:glycosyltransferase involved in cell wall biosynthesis
MTEQKTELSVIIPCYNEEQTLAHLTERVVTVCRKFGRQFEVVLVNDGSCDRTWEEMLQCQKLAPELVLVDLSRNHGQQLAITAGLSVCRGDRVLVLDADLQDPPELIPEMWKLMDQGADVVYGKRRRRTKESYLKKLTAYFFYRVLNILSDTPIPEDVGDFRLMSRRAVDVLLKMPEQQRFLRGMVSWIGFHQVPLEYDRDARFAGATKYPLRKMLHFAADAITSFSIRPLRLAVYMACGFGFCGLMMLGYVFYSMTTKNYVSGWASMMAVMLIGFSFQSFLLGLLGEYVGRIFLEAKRRPLYIIREIRRTN